MSAPLPLSVDAPSSSTLNSSASPTGDALPSLQELAKDINHPSPTTTSTTSAIDVEKGIQVVIPSEVERPYSAFSKHTRWMIVGLSVLAGFFSPISSNIYVPAIPLLTRAFNVSAESMNLTVTVFMVFQGLTPGVWGSMADSYGRRPVYLITLSLFLVSCIGTALCPTDSFGLLMFLRILQATGGSAVIAIGSGCMADIASQHERGVFLGVFQSGNMLGPSIGPVLGGVFAASLGWRAIFWFLVIASTVCLIPMILFFPETTRSIVGDGSIHPPTINCTPAELIRRAKKGPPPPNTPEELATRAKPRKFNVLASLLLLKNLDVAGILLFGSLVYTEGYMILTVLSTLLEREYGLTEIPIGLCYLPNGVGAMCATIINGRLSDRMFQSARRKAGLNPKSPASASVDFPLERIRLALLPYWFVMFHAAAIGVGWSFQGHAPLAVPVVLQFFVGFGSAAHSNTSTLLVVDLLPGQGGAATAAYNLVRCLLGAAGVGVVQISCSRIGSGWTFIIFSGISALSLPIPLWILKNGPRLRRQRAEKAEKKRLEDEQRTAESSQVVTAVEMDLETAAAKNERVA